MRAALLILGLIIIMMMIVKALSWSGQIETPIFRGVFQAQFAVGL